MTTPIRFWTIAAALSTFAVPALAGPPKHAGPAIFATDATTPPPDQGKPPIAKGAAAIIDGHVIPMNDVVLLSLRDSRSYLVDQLIQNYVVDRDCKRRHITVSDAEINAGVERLRKSVAPATVEDTLKLHHMTVAEMRYAFKQRIERNKLVADQIKPTSMAHCREILVKFNPTGGDETVTLTTRTEEQALALLADIHKRVLAGDDFGKLADKYSELDTAKTKNGDLGVIYDGSHDLDASVPEHAFTLRKGEMSPEPFLAKGLSAYIVLQCLSTDKDHPASENKSYKLAFQAYSDFRTMMISPKYVVDLMTKARLTFASDADLVAGKPLPKAAATVDGHVIPMDAVAKQCLQTAGPHMVDILVQQYVVDRECQRRGITVTDADIDRRVDQLRAMVAPATMDEALKAHNTTMDALRRDFRQEIERTKLVEANVPPTKMVHCEAILVRYCPPGTIPGDGGNAKHTRAQAFDMIRNIQSKLRDGADFDDLAAKYSDATPSERHGDIGIFYAGMAMDTAMLNNGLALESGQTSADYIETDDGYCILRAVSTSDKHSPAEDELYQTASQGYHEQEANRLAPQAIVDLIKKSKVIYYVHS